MAAPHFLAPAKDALRARLLPLVPSRPEEAHEAVRAAVREAVGAIVPGARVAAFLPLLDEPDLRPLFPALVAAGAAVLLPVVDRAGAPLRFRRWHEGVALRRGPLGTSSPAEGPSEAPDLILVPLVGFDRAGRRLGRGGGFYDRTLAVHPAARAIGVGWAAREVEAVPSGPYDVALGVVATDAGLVAIRATAAGTRG